MPATSGLTFERLLDWIEGRLSAEEAREVSALVAQADENVQKEVTRQYAFQALSERTLLAAPPPEVRSVLMERFRQHAKGRQSPSLFQRLIAILSYDSALQPNLVGVRSASTTAPRQLVYSTEIADIVFNIQWREQTHVADLFGQILPLQNDMPLEDFVIQLLTAGREVSIVMADEIGEFTFEALPAANYEVVLSAEKSTIVLPQLTLQPPDE